MPVFIYTKHTASGEFSRVIEVTCEKCGCVYYYQLKRKGTGTEISAYFLFQDLARETAEARATEDGQNRLSSEADLVPCPQCNWINEELVQGYRISRCRGWTQTACWIAVIGLGVCAGAVSLTWGIPNKEAEFFCFAVICPAVLIIFAGGVFLGVREMRQSIQPNCDFPNFPLLPTNTPPALLLDADSGKLIPATTRQPFKW